MVKDIIVVDGETYKKVNKKMTTNVIVILDMSGSMADVKEATISGYNEYLSGLRADGNSYKVSLTLFDTEAVTEVYSALPVAKVANLTDKVYKPLAGTPLYDAVCETISPLTVDEVPSEKYLVVIITDGEENSSKEYTEKDMKRLKEKLEAKGNFSFVYLGANQDAWAVAHKWGFSKGNTATYNATERGTRAVFYGFGMSTSSFSAQEAPTTTDFLSLEQQEDIKETK